MCLVRQFYIQYGKPLGLVLEAGSMGLNRRIKKAEVQRPGLGLAGYVKGFVSNRIMIFGKQEIQYLKELESPVREERLRMVLTGSTPAAIIAKGFKPPKEMLRQCELLHIPLFRANLSATNLLNRVTFFLLEKFCPSVTLHGTLVEVFGVGVLIQGESSIGKSEAALGLIERGHRLVSDDAVKVQKKEDAYLIGSGPELTRHLMEIRGIGIINVANLYGATCVRRDKGIDLIVKLEEWDDQHFYDRVGLDEKFIDVLGSSVPFHVLPVKPGRDVVLLLETIALNHRLKVMGYHAAKEFNAKWLESVAKRKKKKVLT